LAQARAAAGNELASLTPINERGLVGCSGSLRERPRGRGIRTEPGVAGVKWGAHVYIVTIAIKWF